MHVTMHGEWVDEQALMLVGRGPLELRIFGPEAAPQVQVGTASPDRFERTERGWLWRSGRVLGATAGPLQLLVQAGGERWTRTVLVHPVKLGWTGVLGVLDELDELAAEVGGALAQAEGPLDPGAALSWLDGLLGRVQQAATEVRRRPLHRVRERVRAVPATRARPSPRDLRWHARHPAAVLRASGGGAREVALVRDRRADLDVPENRGVVAVFERLQRLAEAIEQALEGERRREGALRAWVAVAPRAAGSQVDPSSRLRAGEVLRRTDHLVALRGHLEAARVRCGLPANLPSQGALRRTAQVDGHPGYWAFFGVQQQLDRHELTPWWSFTLDTDLDRTWELWCVLAVVRAVASWAGVSLAETMELDGQGGELQLPRDRPVLTVQRGQVQVCVRVEPPYPDRGRLGRLTPGRPLRPDVVVELSRAGVVYALHVFDAKHRLAPAHRHRDGEPIEALDELWLKYGDGIGDRHTGLPLVSSVWMLWPGQSVGVRPRLRAMLEARWPLERLRGGSVALYPGAVGGQQALARLIQLMLDEAA